MDTTTLRGTCQICLRNIGTKTGRVAYHGYKRPHRGWQTGSCFGAMYRPLEVACDALNPAIDGLASHIIRTTKHLEELEANPPATLSRRDAYGRVSGTYERPEGFDTSRKPASYRVGYESEYWHTIVSLQGEVRACVADVAVLEERLANWRAKAA